VTPGALRPANFGGYQGQPFALFSVSRFAKIFEVKMWSGWNGRGHDHKIQFSSGAFDSLRPDRFQSLTASPAFPGSGERSVFRINPFSACGPRPRIGAAKNDWHRRNSTLDPPQRFLARQPFILPAQ
jgi:hypothetical protein